MSLKLVIITFSVLALLEGLFMILFQKTTVSLLKQMITNNKTVKEVALTEIIISIIIFLIAFYLM